MLPISNTNAVPDTAPDFAVLVETIVITPHPNADAIELANIGGYQAVVRKGQFQTGDRVAYIPEQAILPDTLIQELGLQGRLAGAAQNRVKALRLRGVLSQGLCVSARDHWAVGQDVTAELGITKHEVPVPAHLAGQVWLAGTERTLSYDIPNIKRYPDALHAGEPVVVTEKLHGTWCLVGWMPPRLAHPDYGRLVVASKGIAGKGHAFDTNAAENADNLYLQVVRALRLEDRLATHFGDIDQPVFVLGEVFGEGIQDLGYGIRRKAGAPPGFRVFDVRLGAQPGGRWLDDAELTALLDQLGLPRVPVVYRGPFQPELLDIWTVGRETLSGHGVHLREGVVVRTQTERRFGPGRRAQLKSINPAYLLRKDATEYN